MPSAILLMYCELHLGEVTCSKSDMAKQSLPSPNTISRFFSSDCFLLFVQINTENHNILTHKDIRRTSKSDLNMKDGEQYSATMYLVLHCITKCNAEELSFSESEIRKQEEHKEY